MSCLLEYIFTNIFSAFYTNCSSVLLLRMVYFSAEQTLSDTLSSMLACKESATIQSKIIFRSFTLLNNNVDFVGKVVISRFDPVISSISIQNIAKIEFQMTTLTIQQLQTWHLENLEINVVVIPIEFQFTFSETVSFCSCHL